MSPDFIIIGAMKCGTSTLHAQLAAQPGVFMADPKEPNFFSDDAVYARGVDWYRNLFAAAPKGAICGEASTHYTKRPTYPHTVDRMAAACTPRLIYLVRNPVARAISHHIHGWSLGDMPRNPVRAFTNHPELIDYGCYGMQIRPFVRAFGRERILLVSLERMQREPQAELSRVGAFLGLPKPPVWQQEHSRANVSAERIRRFPLYDLLVDHPLATRLRRALVPQNVRDHVKRRLQMRERPDLPADVLQRMEDVFAADFVALTNVFPDADLSASYPFLRSGVTAHA